MNVMGKSNGRFRAFVFDLDGTLVDSKLDIANAVNAMLPQMRRQPLPLDVITGYIGHGAPRLVACALGPSSTESERIQGLAFFLEHYRQHPVDHTRPYSGVIDGLQSLRGCPLAVLTNKPADLSGSILKALGLAKYFLAVYGGDSFSTKKPDPAGVLAILRQMNAEPASSAMIGDSDVDVQTARNAGMGAVIVNYGFGQYDRSANPADIYLDHFSDVQSLRQMADTQS